MKRPQSYHKQPQTRRASPRPLSVGVIFSPNDLRRATKLRSPPDLFELRLDALAPHLDKYEKLIAKLRAPFLITARHPREGGANSLSTSGRKTLLLHFLPRAKFIDVELRSARLLHSVLKTAVEKKVGRIISVHDFQKTPASKILEKYLADACRLNPDIFKLATRVETANDESRLLKFFGENRAKIPLAVMGMGRRGRSTRIALAHRGSVLNYTYIYRAQTAGQLSLAELRAIFRTDDGYSRV